MKAAAATPCASSADAAPQPAGRSSSSTPGSAGEPPGDPVRRAHRQPGNKPAECSLVRRGEPGGLRGERRRLVEQRLGVRQKDLACVGELHLAAGPLEQPQPQARSRRATAWLTAGWVMPRPAAAREKLRCRATSAKQLISRSGGPDPRPQYGQSRAGRSSSRNRSGHAALIDQARCPGDGMRTVLGYPRIGPGGSSSGRWSRTGTAGSTREELLDTGRRLRTRDLAAARRRWAWRGCRPTPSRSTTTCSTRRCCSARCPSGTAARPRTPTSRMARGTDGLAPLRMTKWFDTNYHYIVPEIGAETLFRLVAAQAAAEVREARRAGPETRPVLVGPVTFLLLRRPAGSPAGFTPLDRLDDVLDVYEELLAAPGRRGRGLGAARRARAGGRPHPARAGRGPAARTTGSGRLRRPAAAVRRVLLRRPRRGAARAGATPGRGDRRGPGPWPAGRALAALAGQDRGRRRGLRAGRVAYRPRGRARRAARGSGTWRRGGQHLLLAAARSVRLWTPRRASTRPCGTGWPSPSRRWREVVELARRSTAKRVRPRRSGRPPCRRRRQRRRRRRRPRRRRPHPPLDEGRSPYPVRAAAQAAPLRLPPLPVTTIGSFPQTGELRAARAAVRGRAAGRGRVRAPDRGRDRAGDPPAGAARPRRAGARRAGAQRHGAVLRRTPRRLRDHRSTAGSSPTAPGARGRPILYGDVAPAGADHGPLGAVRPVADGASRSRACSPAR